MALSPAVAFAQQARGCNSVNLGTVQDFICRVGNIIDLVIPLVILLGVLYFIWGVISFALNSNDEKARENAINRIINGIIGLAVIFAMWGLVRIVQNTFGLPSGQQAPLTPQVPF